jgi:hypothetical protein
MVMKFVSYKLCKMFVFLMCFHMLFVCKNRFPQITFSHNVHYIYFVPSKV